jgi:CheY-like chemotaxis protein
MQAPIPTLSTRAPILVVENNDDLRSVIILILENAGCSAVGVANGKEALDYLCRGRLPSAILLDLKMPLMDGATFRSMQLTEPRWARIPVVVCPAVCDPSDYCGLPGVAAWLRKPFSATVLVDAVRRHRLAS